LSSQSTPPHLAVYGHVGFDVTSTPRNSTRTIGGAAYYAALAASRRSNSVGIISVAGQDFPLSSLYSSRIDTEGLALRRGNSAEFYQTYDDRHELTHFTANLGVCAELAPDLIPLRYLEARIFFITAAPPEQQHATMEWLVGHGYRGRIAIDTALSYIDGFRILLAAYQSDVEFAFLNLREYTLLDWLPPSRITLVIKRGADGAALREHGVWVNFPAPHVEQVQSTTGAGDILAGACLAGVAMGDETTRALMNGINLASRSVRSRDVDEILLDGGF
jgi:sugar/nucleoside kinase (ribokinase family)